MKPKTKMTVRYPLVLALVILMNQSLIRALLPSLASTSTRIRGDEGFALYATRDKRKFAKPIDPQGWPERYPAKELCSKCGLCETSFVTEVKDACAFLGPGMAKIDTLEKEIHGRQRDPNSLSESFSPSTADEARFGVLHEPIRLAKGNKIENAQWTGVVTGIALSMLEGGHVDAVVCIANSGDSDNSTSFGSPEPILARTTNDVLRGRGVKPALAPSLRVLDEIQSDPSIQRLLFCGVGCAVQAFRAVQSELDLEEVYVLGTNCADNSPTPEAARNFIREGVQIDSVDIDDVQGYEFMQDFKVHVKSKEAYVTKPYFTLPGTIAEASIAKSCRACFDYTNALADVVVGYMGAPLSENSRMDKSFQTLTVRNKRGARMVEIAQKASRLVVGEMAMGEGSHEKLASATVASDAIVSAMVDKPVPAKGMPDWLGQIMAFGIQRIGPKGINFARYSIDYHILRNYLFVLKTKGNQEKAMMALPQNARDVVNYYLENDEAFADLESKIQTADT
jgi:coenzyme F420-reducing hydrogenase beta subunit